MGTFKDGLRTKLVDALRDNDYRYSARALLEWEKQDNGGVNEGVLAICQAALAYCDEWEEVETQAVTSGNARAWYSPAVIERVTTILVRKAAVPTRAERVEAAVREAKKAVAGASVNVNFDPIYKAIDRIAAAAKD
jgi:hypothetical protein